MKKSALLLEQLTGWNLDDFYSITIEKGGISFQGRLTNSALRFYKDIFPFEVSVCDNGFVNLEYFNSEGQGIKIVFTA